MYICSLAKGTDSDNIRHSGPDTSIFTRKRMSIPKPTTEIIVIATSCYKIDLNRAINHKLEWKFNHKAVLLYKIIPLC